MKHLHSHVKEGRTYFKAFPGTKTNQLNHYVIPTLEEFDWLCYNSRRYQRHSSKERDVRTERPSERNNANRNNLST